jgi:hypothetical protein
MAELRYHVYLARSANGDDDDIYHERALSQLEWRPMASGPRDRLGPRLDKASTQHRLGRSNHGPEHQALLQLIGTLVAEPVIAKAERRLAEADKQRARIKADPMREVVRERMRVTRAEKRPTGRDRQGHEGDADYHGRELLPEHRRRQSGRERQEGKR